VLEAASQEFVDATSMPPFIYELTPDEARKVLDDVQAEPIEKLPVDESWITVPAAVGDVRVRIVRPPDAERTPPVILNVHGGGRVQRRHARPARPRAGRRQSPFWVTFLRSAAS
jgi:acetyl esterase/lipase